MADRLVLRHTGRQGRSAKKIALDEKARRVAAGEPLGEYASLPDNATDAQYQTWLTSLASGGDGSAAVTTIRAGVQADRDTLAEMSAALDAGDAATLTTIRGGVPANRDTLQELSGALDSGDAATLTTVRGSVASDRDTLAELSSAVDTGDAGTLTTVRGGVAANRDTLQELSGALDSGDAATLTTVRGGVAADRDTLQELSGALDAGDAATLTAVRGGVAADRDTLAELSSAVDSGDAGTLTTVRGGVAANRDTLQELSGALDSGDAATLTAVRGGVAADRDTLAELSAAVDAVASGSGLTSVTVPALNALIAAARPGDVIRVAARPDGQPHALDTLTHGPVVFAVPGVTLESNAKFVTNSPVREAFRIQAGGDGTKLLVGEVRNVLGFVNAAGFNHRPDTSWTNGGADQAVFQAWRTAWNTAFPTRTMGAINANEKWKDWWNRCRLPANGGWDTAGNQNFDGGATRQHSAVFVVDADDVQIGTRERPLDAWGFYTGVTANGHASSTVHSKRLTIFLISRDVEFGGLCKMQYRPKLVAWCDFVGFTLGRKSPHAGFYLSNEPTLGQSTIEPDVEVYVKHYNPGPYLKTKACINGRYLVVADSVTSAAVFTQGSSGVCTAVLDNMLVAAGQNGAKVGVGATGSPDMVFDVLRVTMAAGASGGIKVVALDLSDRCVVNVRSVLRNASDNGGNLVAIADSNDCEVRIGSYTDLGAARQTLVALGADSADGGTCNRNVVRFEGRVVGSRELAILEQGASENRFSIDPSLLPDWFPNDVFKNNGNGYNNVIEWRGPYQPWLAVTPAATDELSSPSTRTLLFDVADLDPDSDADIGSPVNVSNNDTITLNGRVITFKTALTGAADEVKIGSSLFLSLRYLQSALNGDAEYKGQGPNQIWDDSFTGNPHATMRFRATKKSLIATAITRGPGGDSLTVSEACSNTTQVGTGWGGATLAGGGQFDAEVFNFGRSYNPPPGGTVATLASVVPAFEGFRALMRNVSAANDLTINRPGSILVKTLQDTAGATFANPSKAELFASTSSPFWLAY